MTPSQSPPRPALRSGLPLHEQISSWLGDRIRGGDFQPDEQLPSENELCREFDVSRLTVRRALQTLEADGFIYRRQGLGSFVSDRRVPQGLVRLTDFAQDMRRAGLEASSQILHRAQEPASVGVAEWLGIAPGTLVLRLDRLRLGDGEPIALDRTWLPPYYAQLLEGHDLTADTIYGILEREYQIPAYSGRYRITAAPAALDVAEALAVCGGEALLLIERLSRTAGHRPIYYQHRYYRSDRVAYELEVARDVDSSSSSTGSASGEDPAMPLREFEVVFRPSGDATTSRGEAATDRGDDLPGSG